MEMRTLRALMDFVAVIPAEAGIHLKAKLDSHFRGNDECAAEAAISSCRSHQERASTHGSSLRMIFKKSVDRVGNVHIIALNCVIICAN